MSTGHEQVLGREPAPPSALAGPLAPGLARPARRRAVGRARALFVAARPRQWVKNLLVLAAPAAAGVLGRPGDLWRTAAAVGLFVAASSGTYLLNDVLDVTADRQHPTKRFRPVAAGQLSPAAAVGAAVLLLAAAVAVAPLVAGWPLGLVLGAYVALTLAYSLRLKRVAFVELACISLAFVLRALGGAAATHVPVSPWFLVVTSAGALLLAAGKRGAEVDLLGPASTGHRRSLSAYPGWLLRAIRLGAGAVAVAGYLLWALWRGAHASAPSYAFLGASALPFAVAVAELERLLEGGGGGAPEELALGSRRLQALGLACVTLVALGIYA